MSVREATCRCGNLRATCMGDPVRVSVCHCLECQKRSGSAFAVQARWPDDRVELVGEAKLWSRVGDSGHLTTYRFCANCGSTIAYSSAGLPGITAITVGAFADPDFPAPRFSVYEKRKHSWIAIKDDGIEHLD